MRHSRQSTRSPDVPCTSTQGLVTNFLKILSGGLNPIIWHGHPNYLCVQNANVMRSRPPDSFQAVKIKSHQDPSAALSSVDTWKIRGNDQADKLAK